MWVAGLVRIYHVTSHVWRGYLACVRQVMVAVMNQSAPGLTAVGSFSNVHQATHHRPLTGVNPKSLRLTRMSQFGTKLIGACFDDAALSYVVPYFKQQPAAICPTTLDRRVSGCEADLLTGRGRLLPLIP